MGIAHHIKGYRSKDDPTYRKHLKVLLACDEAGIGELPKETAAYFGTKWPDTDTAEEPLEIEVPVTEGETDDLTFYEVRVADIPEGVDTIRFTVSW